MIKQCVMCKKEIEDTTTNHTKLYCSFECREKSRYKRDKKKIIKRALKYYYDNHGKVLKRQIARLENLKKTDDRIRKLYLFRKVSQKAFPLKDKSCEVCGSVKKLQRHHLDYSNPYLIKILCRKHHNELHRLEKQSLYTTQSP